ncbi:hypothetical protein DIPPA_07111 [Diplonema papillatum]|nr:hypothetical protein DIPPA_07111 [Diplonema papillatum]
MADDAAAIEGRRHCTHWIKGECRYGGLCRFEHDGARKGEQAKVESGGKPSHRHGARGKDLRHAAVRRYMVDRWGSLEGLRVVEVAGGSCDLASELCNLAGCEVTVVEPRLAMQKGIQRYQRRLRLGMLHRSPELGGQPIRSAAECAGSPTILPRHARCFFTETLAAAAAAAAGSSPPLCAAVEEQRRLFAAHFGTPSTAEGRGVGPEKKKKKQKMNEKQGGNQKSCTDARLPSNEPPGSEPQRQDGSKHTRSGQGDGGPVDKAPVLTEQVRADPAGRFDAPGEGKPAVVKGHARMDLDEGGTVTAPDEPAILHSVRSALEALAQADVVVAVHPDEPTEPVVDWCLARRLPFVVVPCCVFARSNRQRRVAGEPLAPVTTYEQFIAYLLAKATPDGRPIEAVSLPFSGRNIALVYRPEDETADVVVAVHPDEPTVVDRCLVRRLPFVVVPCCVFARSNRQRRVAGEPLAPVTTYEQFIAYLLAKATPDGRPIEAVSLPFSGRTIALVYRPEDETL